MTDEASSAIPSASLWSGGAGRGAAVGPPPEGYRPLRDQASPTAITVATFLAGPLAGAWLLTRNFRRQGSAAAAAWTLALGIIVTAAVLALATQLPDSLPAFTISLPIVALAWLVTRQTQTAPFAEHLARSGPQTSGGKIALIGFASLAIQFGVLFAGVMGSELFGGDPKIEFAHGNEVYYRDGATADDARRVGTALEDTRFFTADHEASATVQRPGGVITVGVVVGDRALGDAFEPAFRAVAADLSRLAFDGQPVDLWLLDRETDVRRRLRWESGSK